MLRHFPGDLVSTKAHAPCSSNRDPRPYASPSSREHEIDAITIAVKVMSFAEIALQFGKPCDRLPVTRVPVCCRIFAIKNVGREVLDDNQSIVCKNRSKTAPSTCAM